MQSVTVTALVLNFADACRALVPMLDGASVPWGESGEYAEWDRIAAAMFESLVTEPCALAAVGNRDVGRIGVARYGAKRPVPGDGIGYVAVDDDPPRRILGLATANRPFDMVRVISGETEEQMRLIDCRFAFVFQDPDGNQQRLREVELETA
jgi:hypothetical protein